MIANYTIALALSIELFTTLRINQRAARASTTVKRLYYFLCIILPYCAVLAGIVILKVNGDRVFDSSSGTGACTIARHGTNKIALFMVLTLPENLPIYPAAVLSALALIPVSKQVFKTRQFTSSIDTYAKQPTRVTARVTRGGPPPVSHSNHKTVIPKNVLIRMGLWCALLIISGVPSCTILLTHSIEYLTTPNEDPDTAMRLIHILPNDGSFFEENEIELKLLLSIILFLICFGTGKFAFEQYEELWQKIIKLIFRNPFTILRKYRKGSSRGGGHTIENNVATRKPLRNISYRTATFRTSLNTSSPTPATYVRLQSNTPPDLGFPQTDYFLNIPNLNGDEFEEDILSKKFEPTIETPSHISIPDSALTKKCQYL
ncbi:989_t:CDS:2 [Ambispora leptoticha]|uniref:989_t:CDS:1 n=1 Tax=Ambispora leptoticha TaxID=144679 RepID=A0A9N9FAB2_9GLOM|nr:989_t:CDS:2 [Ambispora leptoticha]